jgi:hypothetical protein
MLRVIDTKQKRGEKQESYECIAIQEITHYQYKYKPELLQKIQQTNKLFYQSVKSEQTFSQTGEMIGSNETSKTELFGL